MAHPTPPPPGSVAIVTGASSGIGLALARSLAKRGYLVLAVARRADRLAALAAEAPAPRGAGAVTPLSIDLLAPGAAAAIVSRARALGPLGWVINNAGASTYGRLEDADPEREEALVRLNCEVVVGLTARALPDLVRARRGIVLNVASTAGLQPTPGWAAYGASKAFVLSFTEGLHHELGGSGVSATALCPGPVVTEFFSAMAGESPRKATLHDLSPEKVAAAGIRGALAGRAVVIPGRTNLVMAVAARYSPRALVRWVSGKIGLRYIGLPPLPPRG
jgi:uncharacterized protein